MIGCRVSRSVGFSILARGILLRVERRHGRLCVQSSLVGRANRGREQTRVSVGTSEGVRSTGRTRASVRGCTNDCAFGGQQAAHHSTPSVCICYLALRRGPDDVWRFCPNAGTGVILWRPRVQTRFPKFGGAARVPDQAACSCIMRMVPEERLSAQASTSATSFQKFAYHVTRDAVSLSSKCLRLLC